MSTEQEFHDFDCIDWPQWPGIHDDCRIPDAKLIRPQLFLAQLFLAKLIRPQLFLFQSSAPSLAISKVLQTKEPVLEQQKMNISQ